MAATTLTPLPATACLNDRQVIVAEKEFKSSYVKPKPEPGPLERISLGGWIAGGLGVLFMGMTIVATRAKK